MQVSIQSELLPFVDQLVADGVFPSRDAVVAEALLRWRNEQIRFEELKASLREAQAEIARGEVEEFDVEEILAEGRRMHAALTPAG